jgi:hypothetical protein
MEQSSAMQGDDEILSEDDGLRSFDGSIDSNDMCHLSEDLPEDDDVDEEHDRIDLAGGGSKLRKSYAVGVSTSTHRRAPPKDKLTESNSKLHASAHLVAVGAGPKRYAPRGTGPGVIKKWGNTSTTAMNLRDIVADKSRSNHSTSNGGGGYEGRDNIRMRLQKRQQAKTQRRSDVKNSLANFLNSNNPEDESEGEEEDEEDDSLISDDEDDANGDKKGKKGSDGEESLKSSSRRPARPTRKSTDDRSVGSRTKPSTGSVGAAAPRRRIKAVDSDDASVLSRSRRRVPRRVRGDGDDQSVGSRASVGSIGARRRRQGESQKPSTPSSSSGVGDASGRRRRRTATSAKDEQEQQEKEKGWPEETQQQDSKKKHPVSPRSRPRRNFSIVRDDKSVGSRSGRRKVRPDGEVNKSERKESPKRHNVEDEENQREEGNPSSPPSSPERATMQQQAPTYEDTHTKLNDAINSLAKHIETNPDIRSEERDPDEASENSSRFSFGGVPPPLLQFDPSNIDNVTRVTQNEGKVRSETIKHADGTESEINIRELAGLPTFEDPEKYYNESAASGFSLNHDEGVVQGGEESDDSVSISDFEESLHDDDAQISVHSLVSNRSKSHNGSQGSMCVKDDINDAQSDTSQQNNVPMNGSGDKRTDRPRMEERTKPKKTNSMKLRKLTKSVSMLARKRRNKPEKGDKGAADGEVPTPEVVEEPKRVKPQRRGSFFGKRGGRSKKKEEDAESSGEEEVHKNVFGRKKRTPKNLAHQALDDGSDNSDG